MESGKKIASVWFAGGDVGEKLTPPVGGTLEIVNEFHGTYDTDWIVRKNGEGIELSRHNPVFVESIIWEAEDEK